MASGLKAQSALVWAPVWFLAPILGSSQLPVIPPPLRAHACDRFRHLRSCVWMHYPNNLDHLRENTWYFSPRVSLISLCAVISSSIFCLLPTWCLALWPDNAAVSSKLSLLLLVSISANSITWVFWMNLSVQVCRMLIWVPWEMFLRVMDLAHDRFWFLRTLPADFHSGWANFHPCL